jgi:hypothetical protein
MREERLWSRAEVIPNRTGQPRAPGETKSARRRRNQELYHSDNDDWPSESEPRVNPSEWSPATRRRYEEAREWARRFDFQRQNMIARWPENEVVYEVDLVLKEVEASSDAEDRPICLQTLEVGTKCAETKCKHRFCEDCDKDRFGAGVRVNTSKDTLTDDGGRLWDGNDPIRRMVYKRSHYSSRTYKDEIRVQDNF